MLIGDMDADVDGEAGMDPDPLGEGVNVVVPPEPYFPSTLNRSSFSSMRGKRGAPKRKKSRTHETLPLDTSRPIFQRDRCTITVTQGEPNASGRRKRTYVVASDLSEESRYAVEWGIGTVLRDGDDMLIVTVVENESKVDPAIPNAADRATKLRSQQERQGLAYILVRQATSLLQRTRLHVSVSCQAWHAKNARHMLLDIVDYNDPTMLIVGSRGLGQIKGILLGSTSHYLIQRCAVPVMVARRRLKRPPRRSAHLAKHRVHVSLAEAGIDRVAAKVDQDVAVMRDEMQRDDERRGEKEPRGIEEEHEAEGEGEGEGEEGEGDGAEGEGYLGTKVRG
ncbi:adenine nucleotide alpha hydrolases-like protein [Leucogyrophana mollusca]|uniref:Adenine nucleotide alpha hydrolases-like protein n=1 Tax=Leucogyrophana mollusca TaxID=85980 RepID=A0ACB8BS69_9AGAM|nr:adenine nucleotide alpha hydrolases-like protein [Leucogyrophana mollusca]